MPYCGPMRYAMQFPAHQLGGWLELCVIRGYALSEVCVKRGSTVVLTGNIQESTEDYDAPCKSKSVQPSFSKS